MKVKEESEKVGLKLNIQKTKILASGPITSWQKDGQTVETVTNFIFLGSRITSDDDYSHELKDACSLKESYDQPRQHIWRRQWQLTPVLLPGKSNGQRILVGCSPWGRWESDTTERLHFHFSFHALEKEMAIHSSVLPGESQGWGNPVGCHLWGCTQSDTTEET